MAADVLLGAAAALGAGEPRRARRLLATADLGGDASVVAQAFRFLAGVLDNGWFPGGGAASREPGHEADLVTAPPPEAAAGREAQVLVAVAGHLLAAVPLWRDLVTGAPEVGDLAIRAAQRVLEQLTGLDEPRATAAAAAAVADLLARSGSPAAAAPYLEVARELHQLLGDTAGLASGALAAGDRAALPGSHPELLGERLVPTPQSATVVPDADAAEQQWAEAENAFEAAGTARGLAAVALRRAAARAAVDDHQSAARVLDQGVALAEGSGDGALGVTLEVHRALALIRAGDRADVAAVGGAVAAWALGDGSRAYGRGLARLCVARSARWRHDDVVHARLAHRLAEEITTPLGAAPEAALLRGDQASRYLEANYRRLVFVLTDAEIDEALREDGGRDAVGWARLVERVAIASRDAQGLRDAASVRRVGVHAQKLAEAPPVDTLPNAARVTLARALADIAAEGSVYGPLYEALTLHAEGDPERAGPRFDEALAAAQAAGPLPTLLVLGQTRRFDEAVAVLDTIADQLVADGLADALLQLRVRLRQYEQARALLAGLPVDRPAVPDARPWEDLGLRSEIQLGTDDVRGAAATANTAIARFEEHLAGLGLDVFRTMATDDLATAGLYTTAIRAHARLAAAGNGDADTDTDLARAFELSDRSRAGSLTDLLGRSARAPGAALVRRWQQAGALLARTVEQVGDQIGQPWAAEQIQRQVRDAERALDNAEEALATASPGDLAARRRLPDTPGLATVRERLAPGTLLLQYHAFDDELVAWAVTADSARVVRQEVPTPQLVADARGWHRALARASTTDAARAGRAAHLADLLLRPWAEELAAHDRLVVVPHGPLAVLPFHALPWDGDLLGTGWTTSSLPAASLLPSEPARGRLASIPAATDGQVLLVGDPTYAPGRGLTALPGTRAEVRAIGRLREAEPLLADGATREAVVGRLATARVVHLATHGLLREASPYSAELALAGTSSLTLPDLVGAETSIELAVLSACDSGRGRATAAGDVVGLTRALIAAGADELVVSLWPVDDRLACLTMVALHEELGRETSVAVALERARGRLRALTREEAAAWYRELDPEADASGAGMRRTAREIGGEGALPDPDPTHPSSWAPFVHIGAS
ncbi:CHAT domain-containing protein [Actinomycetospora sp. CA-084318]|uniref:CHAT domain-containing protein n=1 Tax=Actinomycetospora sp. CA-084318 TaxID=3239892 RepID=UPI003D98C66F